MSPSYWRLAIISLQLLSTQNHLGIKLFTIKNNIMNVKRIFGTILTILGIIGLIYTGYELINKNTDYIPLTVIGVIALIFFFAGIGLVKNTKDAA